MMGSTHAMAGFVIWFAMVKANVSPPLGIIAVVLGSLLPDIDHPNGTIRQMMDLPQFLKHPITTIIPHREPTHTIWAGILFSLLTPGWQRGVGTRFAATLETGLPVSFESAAHPLLLPHIPSGRNGP